MRIAFNNALITKSPAHGCSCALLALAIFPCAIHAQIPCSYEVVTIIQVPPCTWWTNTIYPSSISPNGRFVCGGHGSCGDYGRAWIYDMHTGEIRTILQPPGVLGARAQDINDFGVAVGNADIPINRTRGFVYDFFTGEWIDLPAQNPDDGVSSARSINNAGQVGGTRTLNDGGDPTFPTTAFRWSRTTNQFEDLGLVDDLTTYGGPISEDGLLGVYAGYGHAMYWNGVRLHDTGWPRGADELFVKSIVNGPVVGGTALFIENIPPSYHTYHRAFVYREGAMTLLPTLAPPYTTCGLIATNAQGVHVGDCRDITNPNFQRPVVWMNNRIVDISPLIVQAGDMVFRGGNGIATSGRIALSATAPGSQYRAVVLDPIMPIPGDTNCDDVVNVTDLLAVIGEWGTPGQSGDLNGDHIVNAADLLLVVYNWGGI